MTRPSHFGMCRGGFAPAVAARAGSHFVQLKVDHGNGSWMIVGFPSRFAVNNRVVGPRYEVIDQRRRRFAALEVRLYGGDRSLREHERGAAQLSRSGSTKCIACKAG